MKKQLLVLAMSALLLTACGEREEPVAVPATPAPAAVAPAAAAPPVLDDVRVLNIYNWPDYIPENMIAAFEQEFGIEVNYDTFDTNEALHAKMVVGNTGYDIVVPGTVFAKPQIEGGLLQPLDKAKIPNLAHIDPALMAILAQADPGNRHLVPWAWGFTTVGINRTRVQAALGDRPMPANAWDLVFNPVYTSRLQTCGIAVLDSPTEIIPVALHHIGKDPYSNNPADYAAAGEMLAKVRNDIRIFSATLIDDLASGKVCAVIGWSGDINIAADRAREMGSTDVIEALLPIAGALLFADTMAIPADARHPNNAHAFINFYLRPENAARMVNEMNFPTGNKAAIEMNLIKPEIANNRTIFVGTEDFARMIPPGSFTSEARAAMADTYNRFKMGR